ncbi:hypothetical protein JCM10450v2_008029 [Rhodotorula kratochvilovae]
MAKPVAAPATVPHLPVELVENILDELALLGADLTDLDDPLWATTYNRESLTACALVCRAWAEPAQCMLYRSLFLRTDDNCNFLRHLRRYPHLGRHVRGLTHKIMNIWSFGTDNALERTIAASVGEIVAACPNLELCAIIADCNMHTPQLVTALTHAPRLRTLAFRSYPTSGPANAWFEAVVPHLPPTLRELLLQDDCASPAVIFAVPPQVQLLDYAYFREQGPAVVRALHAVLRGHTARTDPLRVRFHLDVGGDAEAIQSIKAGFAERGIDFEPVEVELVMDDEW